MRTLFAYLVRLVAALLIAGALSCSAVRAQIPESIGAISDYGAVLDRHGREEIAARIDHAAEQYGIEIYVLASWENPLSTPLQYAEAVFSAWELSHRPAVLAVFLKTGGQWSIRVVISRTVDARYPELARRMAEENAELVDYGRIEEAMNGLFDSLVRVAGGTALPLPAAGGAPADARGWSPVWIVLVALLVVGVGTATIHRWMCPQCGRLLHVETRSTVGRPGHGRWVYSCRRCGYTREGK